MRVLLDTHTLMWAAIGDRHLSPAARQALEQADERWVSVASLWDIAIKLTNGGIELSISLAEFLDLVFRDLDLRELGVTREHVLSLQKLPFVANHRDPFDRILVAQARAEGLVLLTSDRRIRQQYEVETVW
ncbi:MAG: type II toxin-antitoxin system VapC family toxin [Hyphomicrobiales bacterium]